MIEIFKNPNFNFIGKTKYFIAFSVVLSILGIISMVTRGFNLGVEFAGGTKVTVRFKSAPDENRVREALKKQGIPPDKVTIQRTGKQLSQADRNEIFINVPSSGGQEDADKKAILDALRKYYAAEPPKGAIDINNSGSAVISDTLLEKDPLDFRKNLPPGEAEKKYGEFATALVKFRDGKGGLISNLNDIPRSGEFSAPQFGEAIKEVFYAGEFNIVSADLVGPQVGKDLRNRAIYVTLIACLGMLFFIGVRFEGIYGVGAIVATLHDVVVTLGVFSLFQWEISMTFIAAMLTLVGYSVNDTIVIFDRIRESLKMRRRDDIVTVVNDAVNQTLSRTIIASGLTLLSVIALTLFGGEVLKSFSLALLIGILIGTYSSIAIASPVVIWWKQRGERLRRQEQDAKKATRSSGKSSAKSAALR